MTSVQQANDEKEEKCHKVLVNPTVNQGCGADTLRKDGEGGLAR